MSLIQCKAPLYTINGWTILRLPDSASKQLPSRGQVMVRGTIQNTEFQAALEPDGNGSHWLHVDAPLQKAAQVSIGDTVTMAIEPTKEWPEPPIPPDVQRLLVENTQLRPLWERITPLARWEWLRWIAATNNAETRQRRIEVAGSKLRAGARRPCCFNRSMCCVPDVSKNGVLLDPDKA